jgi:hypothetical protein
LIFSHSRNAYEHPAIAIFVLEMEQLESPIDLFGRTS